GCGFSRNVLKHGCPRFCCVNNPLPFPFFASVFRVMDSHVAALFSQWMAPTFKRCVMNRLRSSKGDDVGSFVLYTHRSPPSSTGSSTQSPLATNFSASPIPQLALCSRDPSANTVQH